MSQAEKLKPCPFCGGENVKTVHVRDGRKVACHCGACGSPEYHGPAGLPTADERAIKEWNRRSTASLSHTMGVEGLECHCTKIEQDETCPVGYPSLLCDDCDGKGIRSALTPTQQPVGESVTETHAYKDFIGCLEEFGAMPCYSTKKRVEQAVAALASPQAVTEWEKIETAPKKGMPRILLALPDGRVCEGYWGAAKYNRKNKEYDSAWVSSPHSGDVHPTHWMPLPKAPALNAEVSKS